MHSVGYSTCPVCVCVSVSLSLSVSLSVRPQPNLRTGSSRCQSEGNNELHASKLTKHFPKDAWLGN